MHRRRMIDFTEQTLMTDQIDVVKFFSQVIRMSVEPGAVNDSPAIIHVNDEGMREGGEAPGVDDGEIALSPDAWSMSVAEQKQTGGGTIAVDESSGVVDGAGPIVKGDEDSPWLGEKLPDHVRLRRGAGAGVVIVKSGDHLRLFGQECFVVDVAAIGPDFEESLSLADHGGRFARPRSDGGVKAVAVREEDAAIEQIKVVRRRGKRVVIAGK